MTAEPRRQRGRRSQAGQTFTETAMILGILTALIISLTALVVPAYAKAVANAVVHMVTFVGTY